jgi:hypothetical protein
MEWLYSKVKLSRYTPWRRLGGRRYSSYSFLSSALDGGERSASRPGRALPPGKGLPVPTLQEAGWAPEPVWTQRLEKESSAPVGDRTPVFQSVVKLSSNWTITAPKWMYTSRSQSQPIKQLIFSHLVYRSQILNQAHIYVSFFPIVYFS